MTSHDPHIKHRDQAGVGAAVRIIAHLSDPEDLGMVAVCVAESIRDGHEKCGVKETAFVRAAAGSAAQRILRRFGAQP